MAVRESEPTSKVFDLGEGRSEIQALENGLKFGC